MEIDDKSPPGSWRDLPDWMVRRWASQQERERWSRFADIGCLACRKKGVYNPQVDVHHLLSGGRRRGHDASVPLCAYHHRGVGIHPEMGPSLAHGSKPFHAEFGSDDELLELTDKLLEESRCRKV